MDSSKLITKPRLIALYSPAPQSGKSTVAEILHNEYRFRKLKFASPLKNMLRSLFSDLGFGLETIEWMIEGDLKETPIPALDQTPRALMKSLGTSWGRLKVKDSMWIDLTIAKAQHLMKQGISVLIDDMRYENEWNALKAAGAELWKITRPNASETTDSTGVVCEGLLDDMPFDHNIINDQTKEILEYKARLVVEGKC